MNPFLTSVTVGLCPPDYTLIQDPAHLLSSPQRKKQLLQYLRASNYTLVLKYGYKLTCKLTHGEVTHCVKLRTRAG